MMLPVKEDRSLRTPTVLLVYQVTWQEDQAKVKFIEKSRRIGITWDEASEDALLAASKSGMDVFYIGYNKDMAQEFISDCADWAKFYSKAAGEIEEYVFKDVDKDIVTFRIRFASGFKIIALSSRPSNLRGMQGKVVIDEAAFHDDLKELLKAALALLMWGGRVVVISTHDGDENPFNEYIEDIRAGRLPYSLHRVTFDDAINDGLHKRICLRLGLEWSQKAQNEWRQETIDFYGDGADEELFCIPSHGGGAFFTRPQIKNCMKDNIDTIFWSQKDDWAELPDIDREEETQEWLEDVVQPYLDELDPDRNCWFGEDFARDQNLTVIWPVQEKSDSNLRVAFNLELFNIPFRQQEQILFYVLDRLPCFQGGAMDARGNGQSLAEFAMQRFSPEMIHMIKATDAWYGRWFPVYKATIEDRGIDLPADANVMEDHRAIKKIKGIPKIVETQAKDKKSKKKRHGDSAIAGLMAVYAVNEIEGPGEIDFESTGKKRASAKVDDFLES
jgi:phage FluMu gp28-like protein